MKILQMTDITKRFFGVTVLNRVSFDVEEGEVHALLGENGAGKSTLMNILGGVHQRDGGSVEFCGRPMENITVKAADEAGIAFVHQELNVINDLTVYENLFLNKELLGAFRRLNKKEMIRQAQELFTRLGVDIDPTATVGDLDTSRKQLLEIAKALHAEAKLFILDEPTTALNTEEIEHLFSIVRRLKAEGKAFIFISHKMPEIFEIADRYTILRNGSFISSGHLAGIAPEEVTRQMVGEGYVNQEVYEARPLGEPVLELEALTGPSFRDVTLSVRRGEVVGFTGLKGAGSSELMQAIFGALPFSGGTLKVWGKPVASGTIHRAMKDKLAMLAANRKENSVIPDMTLLENTYCAEHCLSGRHPHIHVKQEVAKYNRLREMLNIKAESYSDLIVSLSGGNQQKVILGRWLNTEAEILLLDNPTQGIDVGAKAEIYKLIQELAKQGKTVIVNTLEIPEIQKVADRCVVFYHGQVQAVLERNQMTEERVMLLATNASAIRAE
jgi:ribose transport system ATP-binding protein